jgi:glycosyltransferase involved in cell wall biosynthesis
VLYNFGDSFPFHDSVFRLSQRVPGIAVLHDFVLHHFFVEYCLSGKGGAAAYIEMMARAHGEPGREAAMASFEWTGDSWRVRTDPPPIWATDRVVEYPLFEPAIRLSTGVIVHADFLLTHVRQSGAVASRRLFLPARRSSASGGVAPVLDVPAGRAVLLTVGHINPNKRVAEVIDALGRHPDLASRVRYVVVGELSAGACAATLRERITTWGLQECVQLLGRRDDAELGAWIDRADVCINLRHPVMEGGSASLAEQMLAGKPAIVSDAGVYAEVPDDCVVKIGPGRESEDLPAVLHRLLDDTAEREARGRRSRAFAETHFDVGKYAEGLAEFVVESGRFAAMARYADRVGVVLQQMGVQPGMPIIDTVADISADLLGEPVTSPWKPGLPDS